MNITVQLMATDLIKLIARAQDFMLDVPCLHVSTLGYRNRLQVRLHIIYN